MNADDLSVLSEALLADAATVIHNQAVLAGIHADLDKNAIRPFEQDYIYADHYKDPPSAPRTIELNGVSITSRVLHQTGIGLSDVRGADLLYEIEDEKFGLIQYKRASNGYVKIDKNQLTVLLGNCPEVCMHNKRRPLPEAWIPLKINSFCGVWYCIVDRDRSGERKYVHGCEAESIVGNKSTVALTEFDFALSKSTFLELFASCRLGALLRTLNGNEMMSQYVSSAIENRHLIFEVTQRGRWSRT